MKTGNTNNAAGSSHLIPQQQALKQDPSTADAARGEKRPRHEPPVGQPPARRAAPARGSVPSRLMHLPSDVRRAVINQLPLGADTVRMASVNQALRQELVELLPEAKKIAERNQANIENFTTTTGKDVRVLLSLARHPHGADHKNDEVITNKKFTTLLAIYSLESKNSAEEQAPNPAEDPDLQALFADAGQLNIAQELAEILVNGPNPASAEEIMAMANLPDGQQQVAQLFAPPPVAPTLRPAIARPTPAEVALIANHPAGARFLEELQKLAAEATAPAAGPAV
jgi:hypothetical protein